MPEQKNNPIVAEIDDFIEKNNLQPIEKLILRVMKYNYVNGLSVVKHVEDEAIHTPKGLLVRSSVIGWAVFLMVLISTIVSYFPEAIDLIKGLP